MVLSLDDEDLEVLRSSTTDPKYGGDPSSRSVEELLEKGCIVLDKPRGPTSHQVVHWVKNILGIDRAGHMGTLDPNTTGVLPIALGSAVRVLEATLSEGKEYIAIMRVHREVDEKTLARIAGEFTGEIYQMVPVRSAVKRGLRTRRIHYLKIIEKNNRDILMVVGCQSGTYIRTLIHDMGEVLGVGANMAELRRTRSGHMKEDRCVTLHDLRDAWVIYKDEGDDVPLREVIRPYELLLEHMPRIIVKDTAVDAICHGAPLASPGVVAVDRNVRKGGIVSILSIKGEIIALAKMSANLKEVLRSNRGEVARPDRVLMAPGTYPSMWKRSIE